MQWGLRQRKYFSEDRSSWGPGEDEEGRRRPCGYLLMMVGRKHIKNFSGIGMKGSSPT